MKVSLRTVTGYYHRVGADFDEITLTAAQTVVPVSYKVGFVHLFREGVEMKPSEYTATNGTSITLDVPAEEDEVIVVKRSKFRW